MYSVTEKTSIGYVCSGKYLPADFVESSGFYCAEDASRFASNRTSFQVWVHRTGERPQSLIDELSKDHMAASHLMPCNLSVADGEPLFPDPEWIVELKRIVSENPDISLDDTEHHFGGWGGGYFPEHIELKSELERLKGE